MLTRKTKTSSPTSTTSSRLPAFFGGFALALVLSLVFLVPIARAIGDEPAPPPARPSAEQQLVAQQFKKTVYHQKRTDRWAHRSRTHDARAHRPLRPTLNLRLEMRRTVFWQKRASMWQAKWAAGEREVASCRQAGFPRWYCPIVIKAAKKTGVPSWSSSRHLAFIIRHESSFNPRADNSTSTAYGLFQMLVERSSDPYVQSVNGIRYVKSRYGSPARAVVFWRSNHWY